MDKPWYRSKTKWGTILLAAAAAAKPFLPADLLPVVQVAESAGLALAGFGVRDALGTKP